VNASSPERFGGGDNCGAQVPFYHIFCEIIAVRQREMDAKPTEPSRRRARPPHH